MPGFFVCARHNRSPVLTGPPAFCISPDDPNRNARQCRAFLSALRYQYALSQFSRGFKLEEWLAIANIDVHYTTVLRQLTEKDFLGQRPLDLILN